MSVNAPPGAQDPTGVYIAAMSAFHWKTRWQAAQALGELSDTRAVKPLVKALDDSNQWVRIVAAEALGQIGDPEAVPPLVNALDDNSIWVRRASVVALGHIGAPQSIPPLLERLLRPPDCEWPQELHDVIATALGDIGEPAIQALIDALDAPDVWSSSAAAKALGQIGASQAVVPLTKLIKHENKWLRLAATQSLAQIADTRAVRAVLTTDQAPRAFWKLMALKKINAPTINQLMTLLQDPDEQIRDRAAQVLGQFDDAGSITPLGATLRAETRRMTNTQDVMQDQRDWEKAMETSPLLGALRDSDTEVRLAAAEALGKIGNANTVVALNQALQDKDSRVRAAAARSLGEISKKLID